MVHGGERFSESVLLNKEVLDAFIACNDLAPLHNPAKMCIRDRHLPAQPHTQKLEHIPTWHNNRTTIPLQESTKPAKHHLHTYTAVFPSAGVSWLHASCNLDAYKHPIYTKGQSGN